MIVIPELMTAEQAAAYFPGKGVRWVMDTLVRCHRVDTVKIKGSRFIVGESLQKLVRESTIHGHQKGWH